MIIMETDHSLFAEGLPLSVNTCLHAQSASLIFKRLPKPEVGHFGCKVRVLPISLLHVHVHRASELQPDFGPVEV